MSKSDSSNNEQFKLLVKMSSLSYRWNEQFAISNMVVAHVITVSAQVRIFSSFWDSCLWGLLGQGLGHGLDYFIHKLKYFTNLMILELLGQTLALELQGTFSL